MWTRLNAAIVKLGTILHCAFLYLEMLHRVRRSGFAIHRLYMYIIAYIIICNLTCTGQHPCSTFDYAILCKLQCKRVCSQLKRSGNEYHVHE